jgi:hypothetical protein
MRRFPIQVRFAIRMLFGQSPELVHSRDDTQQARQRAVKLSQLRFLEDYFISRIAARQGLQLTWHIKAPFCLFLRSYTMGHLTGRTPTERPDLEWLDTHEAVGGRLLRLLANALKDRAALVAIANPDEWLPHRLVAGPFANLVIDGNAWRQVVGALIPAAQLIVVHLAEASPGLNHELEAIRADGRADATVVVREPALDGSPAPVEPSSFWASLDKASRREKGRQVTEAGAAAFPPDPALDGLSVLEWRDDETITKTLSEAIERLLKTKSQRRFGPLSSLDLAWAPPEERADYLRDARRGYEMASQYIAEGDLLMAEELLFECFAASCACDDLGGRASACLELGRLFLLRIRDAQAAVTPLEYASGHFSIVEDRDSVLQALHLYAAAKLMCGDAEACRAILEHADSWQQTRNHRTWQARFWQLIVEVAGDVGIASFAANVSRMCDGSGR